MGKFCLCVDLDHTLLVARQFVTGKNKGLRHLDEVYIKIADQTHNFYAINISAMRLIFKKLITAGVQIVFVTSAAYDASIINAIEQLYELSPGALKSCLYINRFSEYSKESSKKGSIIKAAQQDGKIPDDAEVYLLDDSDKHLDDAKDYNFKTIKAQGYPSDDSEICNDYLYEIISAFKLGIHFTMGDSAQSHMKKYRMGT